MRLARWNSGCVVMFSPLSRICPESGTKVPATALRRVDFPDPLVPMTLTKEALAMLSETLRSDITALEVSGKNVLLMC